MEPLINLLNDPIMEVRYEAVIALGELDEQRAIKPLINALEDKSPIVQNEAIKALGKLGAREALPKIFQVLRSEKWREVDIWSRTEALRGFKDKLKSPQVLPILKELLNDKQSAKIQGSVVAREAAFILAVYYNDPSGAELLRKYLRADDYSQQDACIALSKLKYKPAVPDIGELVLHSYWIPNRRIALEALLEIGSNLARPYLEKLIDDRDPYIRSKAAKALGIKLAKKENGEVAKQSFVVDRLQAVDWEIKQINLSKVGNKEIGYPLLPERIP